MRIITSNTMTCNTCNTNFEYEDNEMLLIQGCGNMRCVICPTCGQQIMLIADEFKPVKERIIIEEKEDEEEKTI